MVDALLDVMLGPFRIISEFYIEYQTIFNPIVVGVAAWRLLLANKKKQQKLNQNES